MARNTPEAFGSLSLSSPSMEEQGILPVPEALQASTPKVLAASPGIEALLSGADDTESEAFSWIVLQRKAEWKRVSAVLGSSPGAAASQSNSKVHRHLQREADAALHMLASLEVPPALAGTINRLAAIITAAAPDTEMRRSSASDAGTSSSYGSSDGLADEEVEEEEPRGRQLLADDAEHAQMISMPAASTAGMTTRETRSDSAVAGLGFSPRDERRPVGGPAAEGASTMQHLSAALHATARPRLALLSASGKPGGGARDAKMTEVGEWLAEPTGEVRMPHLPAMYCA